MNDLAALLQTPGWSKLDTDLAEIALGVSSGSSGSVTKATSGPSTDSLFVSTVSIDATAIDGVGATLLQQLEAIGLQDGATYGGDVGGVLPTADVAKLMQVADLAHVYEDSARVAAVKIPNDASVGLNITDAASKYGATGAGVKVGILSDSFNEKSGTDTMQTDIEDGYLPVDTKIVQEGTGNDEGRAMAEIVHEIAPNASILFATANHDEVHFADNILQLAADGAKVIVDDVSYFDEPYYQQGIVAQAVNQVESEGVVFLSSSGNEGDDGYQTNFRAGSQFTYGGVTYTAANFASTGDALADSLLPISSAGASNDLDQTTFSLFWSQPAFSASDTPGHPGVGATGNLALFLTDAAGNIVGNLDSVTNDIGGDPYQAIRVNDSLVGTYYLRVGFQSGDQPANFKIVASSDASPVTFGDQDNNLDSGTFYGHAAASGAIGVGAVDDAFTPGEDGNPAKPPISESYSASGPDTIYYDTSGNALSAPIDDEVTLSGTDGVRTSFFPGPHDDFFFGTSAAAPSVAGVVADMLQENPTLTVSQIKNALINSAIPTVDVNNQADPQVGGAGLVDGDKALTSAGSPPPTIVTPPSGSTISGLDDTIVGFGEPGATIGLSIDSSSPITTVVEASGLWNYTPTTPLAPGQHNVSATQTNASNLISPASSLDSFTIQLTLVTPIITGSQANQTADESQIINPFANVVITDPTPGQTETVTIADSAPLYGALSDPNASTDGSTFANGALTFAGSASAVTSEINQLVFTPIFNNISLGQTEASGFAINVTDTAGATASNAATSLVVTQGDPDSVLPFASAGAQAGLIQDAKGDLYGLLPVGVLGNGQIFEIVNTGTASAPVYATTLTDLHDLVGGSEGSDIDGPLHMDGAGNLFGEAKEDGANGYGDVFELANKGTAAAPSFSGATLTAHTFDFYTTGSEPVGGLVADASGNLFGATETGGSGFSGAIFEIANSGTPTAPTYATAPAAIADFDNTSDFFGLAIDSQANLFGVTQNDQAFELPAGAAPTTNAPGNVAALTDIAASNAAGDLVVDANGNLFGVTESGGSHDDGVVYELAKNSSYAPTRLYSFTGGIDGSSPIGALTLDANGDIFGTTTSGGEFDDGVVFELANNGPANAPVYATAVKTLLNFDIANGEDPVGGMTLNGAGDLIGVTTAGGPNGDGVVFEVAPCYCRGTRIATERGEVAVEDLRIGDRVMTASGALRPVVWLGHRRINLRRHPAPELVRPIRIRAHAFGEGLPRRDLWLSPGHNIASEGALIPASVLINGLSVAQIETNEVEYWHVELDAHDVMLAEGLPAESYLDCGNRSAFANGGAFVEAHPNFEPKHWAATCLPLIKQGPAVERTRRHLMENLRARGHAPTRDADPHILADGRRIEPTVLSESRLAFVLPGACRDVALRSRRFVPADIIPGSADTRELGLCVARLQIDGEELPIERDAVFGEGWRAAEQEDGRVAWRWTAGVARLSPGARVVLIDLAGFGHYWREQDHGGLALSA